MFDIKAREIASRIKRTRKRQGMTFLELADNSRISKGALSKIENGVNCNPTLKTLMSLAWALSMKLDDLVKDNPITKPKPKP